MKGYRYNKSGVARLRRCLSCKRRWTVGSASKGNKPPSPQAGGNALKQAQPAAPMTEPSGQIDHLARDKKLELTLSGEGSPSHEDPGGEERSV